MRTVVFWPFRLTRWRSSNQGLPWTLIFLTYRVRLGAATFNPASNQDKPRTLDGAKKAEAELYEQARALEQKDRISEAFNVLSWYSNQRPATVFFNQLGIILAVHRKELTKLNPVSKKPLRWIRTMFTIKVTWKKYSWKHKGLVQPICFSMTPNGDIQTQAHDSHAEHFQLPGLVNASHGFQEPCRDWWKRRILPTTIFGLGRNDVRHCGKSHTRL